MRKRRIKILAITGIILLGVFVFYYQSESNKKINFPEEKKEENIIEENIKEEQYDDLETTDSELKLILKSMSLEEKVGQMFMIGFSGTEVDNYVYKMIAEKNIGGVIMMKRNVLSREQLMNLTKTLQEKAAETRLAIPLFIAVDQEGGAVNRVKVEGVTEFTSQEDIENEKQAYLVAKKRAEELSILGFNVNFSPVLDIINNPESFMHNRVFRGSLDKITSLGASMVRGYQDNNIISVPKHFPGHDNDSVDSHLELPEVKIEKSSLLLRLDSFASLIESSSPKMIMIGHILYKNVDSDYPSSLSKIIIQDNLKNKLDYTGLVITDDMEMKALTNNYSIAYAAVNAIKAGNDILLYSGITDKKVEAYNAVIKAVADREISEERIDESVLRILKLKKEYLQK